MGKGMKIMLPCKNEKGQLYHLLVVAYNDVQTKDKAFANILEKAMKKIDDGYDYKLLCTSLSNHCDHYLLKNIGNIPQSVIDLNEDVHKIDRTYRGLTSLILNL